MQRDSTTDDEQPNEPDWELATYARRMGAWALDFVGGALPLTLLIWSQLGFWFVPWTWRSSIYSVLPHTMVIALIIIVLIGYIMWWLFALGRGQTPGKQIVGIRVIKNDGTPSGWGYTFLREFVIKFLLLGLLFEVTFGIAKLVDYLWPLWDRAEKMQTLHDKLLGTIVVRNR